jgi:hypothetical protein
VSCLLLQLNVYIYILRTVAGDEGKILEPATRTRVYVCGEGMGPDSNYVRLTVMINDAKKCRGLEAGVYP